MTDEPDARDAQRPPLAQTRLFLHEPGWRIALKVGSDRTFCYMTAPGQDYYHRLLDGELYVYQGDERLCLACAGRRGLFSTESRSLRDRGPVVAIEAPELPTGPTGTDLDLPSWEPSDES